MADTGFVGATPVDLHFSQNGEVFGSLSPGTRVEVMRDFGDDWPLVKTTWSGQDAVGFIDKRQIAWGPAPAQPAQPSVQPAPPVQPTPAPPQPSSNAQPPLQPAQPTPAPPQPAPAPQPPVQPAKPSPAPPQPVSNAQPPVQPAKPSPPQPTPAPQPSPKPPAHAAALADLVDPCWIFSQSTGRMFHLVNGALSLLAKGYSGNGASENNPEDETIVQHGPLPRGRYQIGPSIVFKGMAFSHVLTPVHPEQMHGRAGFLIHDGRFSGAPHGMTSEGCICLPTTARQTISNFTGHPLFVVRDDPKMG